MNTHTILEKLKIESLNAMQKEACHAILRTKSDIVILSPTGSGKTLAYLLPLVQMIDEDKESVQAIVLVPGRELALQSVNVLQSMGTRLRAMSCYGGRPTMDEHRLMKKINPQILFCTPGRLNDHIEKGNFSINTVKWVVIDEFDKCLEMGFRDEMSAVLNRLVDADRHILLSATDTAEIPHFVNINKTNRINYLDHTEMIPDRVSLFEVRSPDKDKLKTLNRLLCCLGSESTIIFLNYRESVERTDRYLREHGFYTSSFHGGMEQKAREDALYKFANGSANIFVSTDLASRGLDIPDVNNIIHYHLPIAGENYIHRVGRTARWEASGRSFFILGPEEFLPEYIKGQIESYTLPEIMGKPAQPRMTTIYIGKGKKDKISKGDIVGFLCKKGGLEKHELGRIDVRDYFSYAAIARNKLKQVLELTKSEKIKGIKTVVEPVK